MKNTNQLFMSTNSKLLRFTLAFMVNCLFFTSRLTAQTEKIAFEKYGVAEGLPEEVGFRFVQDKLGYIWIGTQNGLAKFDGYTMEVFRANPDDPDGLHLRNLNGGLLITSDDKLWIAGVSASGGLASYDPTTEKFNNYTINLADSTKVPYSTNGLLFEDVAKNIWFGSYGNNQDSFLCRIDPKTQKVSRYPYRVGRKNNDIALNFEIAESKQDSSIWLRTADYKMVRFDRKKDLFETQFQKGDIIPGTSFTDSIVDINRANKSGLISMANNQRLFLWDPLLRKVVDTYNFTNRDDIAWGANFEDVHGNFWVSSHGNLTRINREQEQREDLKFGKGVLDFKISGDVLQIIPLNQNDSFLFFGITSVDNNNERFDYTLRYDFKRKSFEFFDSQFNDDNNQFADNGAGRRLVIDKTGLLWVGTRPNIYKQSPKTRQIAQYKNDPEDMSSLPSDFITTLFEDNKQQLWLGTADGIALKDNESFKSFGWFSRNKTGTTLGFIRSIIEDSNGVLWVGSTQGLFRWSDSKNSFEKLYEEFGRINIGSLAEDNKGQIWVSAFNRGVYILDIKKGEIINRFETNTKDIHGLLSNRINTQFLDSRGAMWLGDNGDNDIGLFRYIENENKFVHYNNVPNDLTSIISNEIHFLAEDDLDRMWLGTDGGISLYDRDTDNFSQNNDVVNLPSTNVYTKATDGKMWIVAYSGGGLSLVGPGINDVTTYGEDKGLLHNDGKGIVFDDLGKLWIPTARGLSVLDTLTKTYTSYFEKDGFQNDSRRNSILKTKNGDIWIGGENGLNHIVPGKLAKKDTTLPSVYITKMGIMDSIYSAPDGDMFKKAVTYTDQVTLKYWQKNLSFNFVGIHFLRPEDNQYSWKLENYDTNWTTPSAERRAAYTNLSPGTYTFRVKASNADGVWNEEGDSIQIIINPPWWLTWWAFALYSLLLLLIGYRFLMIQRQKTLRIEREKNQQKELEQAKEIEKAYTDLKATQSQLIQSEKMASLGELTAGIAHEIQNPLNFVNNFSEVNSELIEEMKEELNNGNLEEVQSLADDINENEKKIMFHGKRADSIVKGMLQHSRASGDKKEPTNINALVDEYLRLAYHGLRAKDKAFNADMHTDLDERIKSITVISQDIGRVVLNLVTNAFYAVNEKAMATKASGDTTYKPAVSVATKKKKDSIIITVTDNGNGIPDQVRDKIFQPFFTTKPTGQGTGLGLSMSYDIVTNGHGGELKVETKEGKGTEFTIQLPN